MEEKNIRLELDVSYLSDMFYMPYQASMYYHDDVLLYVYVYNTIPIYFYIYVSRETFYM